MVAAGVGVGRLWRSEPPAVGEERWTPGGAGWSAWNGKSPEVEFVNFVAAVVALVRPARMLETGVGQGYTTRRIIGALPRFSRLDLYESDPEFRVALNAVAALTTDRRVTIAADPTPHSFAGIEIAVLDSQTGLRIAELVSWVETAPPGSMCIVHDVSASHPDGTIHRRLATATATAGRTAGITGFCLPNPRGSWIAHHD